MVVGFMVILVGMLIDRLNRRTPYTYRVGTYTNTFSLHVVACGSAAPTIDNPVAMTPHIEHADLKIHRRFPPQPILDQGKTNHNIKKGRGRRKKRNNM